MSTFKTTYNGPTLGSEAIAPDRARELFGTISVVFGLNIAAAKSREQLAIFGAFTVFDFHRLRRTTADSAVLIASSIFLDIFNVFLLVLDLFGSKRD